MENFIFVQWLFVLSMLFLIINQFLVNAPPEAYLEPSRTSTIKPLTNFGKSSIVDVRLGTKYASTPIYFNSIQHSSANAADHRKHENQ